MKTPPEHRSTLGKALNVATQSGKLVLQHCSDCAAVQYPPREICRHCLSDQLQWQLTDNGAVVLATTDLATSLEPFFQQLTPWHLASAKLDCDVTVLCHIDSHCCTPGTRVQIISHKDTSGQAVLIAIAPHSSLDDKKIRQHLLPPTQ